MANTASIDSVVTTRSVENVYNEERGRLRNFILKNVPRGWDPDDILQDVFFQFVQTEQHHPIENATAWLYRVTRNRIIDLFRKKKEVHLGEDWMEPGGFMSSLRLGENTGPEAVLARKVIWSELMLALDELPAPQRQAFEAHELEGVSFKELSLKTGVSVQTLISRKRYAVSHLRMRLKNIYKEFVDEK